MPKLLVDVERIEFQYLDELEEMIKDLFKKEIYIPLLKELKSEHIIKNDDGGDDKNPIIKAIEEGSLSYEDGKFSGDFNSKIVKEIRDLKGKKIKGGDFIVDKTSMPGFLVFKIQQTQNKNKKKIDKVKKKLSSLDAKKISKKLAATKFFESTLKKVSDSIDDKIAGLVVAPKITKIQRLALSEEYTNNLQKYIKGWTDQEIVKLRKEVIRSSKKGFRYQTLVKKIQRRYGVSESKAKFLARQETGLMMSKFRESRFKAAGSVSYVWKSVVGTPSHPVRDAHKKLDGKTFKWDNPPVSSKNGRRNHPGEDFNCRCRPQAIISF